jgi:hypothetical protein
MDLEMEETENMPAFHHPSLYNPFPVRESRTPLRILW